ncbi:MAG: transporter substrate-binding domain-containing protein [Desulfovibrionaceae bacterium]
MYVPHRLRLLLCWLFLLPAVLITPRDAFTAAPVLPSAMNLCVVENNPPFAFRNTEKELTGFNVDMWNAMNIPYAFTYRHPDFPTALAALDGGFCHMLLTNISITPERMQRFTLSEPYLRSGLGIMVRGAEMDIDEPLDLKEKTVAVLKGSTAENFAMTNFKSGELLALNSEFDLYSALVDMKADAIIGDLPMMQHFATHEGRGFVRILNVSLTPQLYAYGFSHGVEAVRDSVNAAIKRLQADGTVNLLYQKWFGAALVSTPLTNMIE